MLLSETQNNSLGCRPSPDSASFNMARIYPLQAIFVARDKGSKLWRTGFGVSVVTLTEAECVLKGRKQSVSPGWRINSLLRLPLQSFQPHPSVVSEPPEALHPAELLQAKLFKCYLIVATLTQTLCFLDDLTLMGAVFIFFLRNDVFSIRFRNQYIWGVWLQYRCHLCVGYSFKLRQGDTAGNWCRWQACWAHALTALVSVFSTVHLNALATAAIVSPMWVSYGWEDRKGQRRYSVTCKKYSSTSFKEETVTCRGQEAWRSAEKSVQWLKDSDDSRRYTQPWLKYHKFA